MTRAIFTYRNYKEFIEAQIMDHAEVRGYQGRMAEAMGCPRSYLSQVLHSKAHLKSGTGNETVSLLGAK